MKKKGLRTAICIVLALIMTLSLAVAVAFAGTSTGTSSVKISFNPGTTKTYRAFDGADGIKSAVGVTCTDFGSISEFKVNGKALSFSDPYKCTEGVPATISFKISLNAQQKKFDTNVTVTSDDTKISNIQKSLDPSEKKLSVSFKYVVPKDISKCTIDPATASFTYDGTQKKAFNAVKDGGYTLKASGDDKEYVVKGDFSATNAGQYTATIEGQGNYKGTKTVNWSIARAVPKAEDFDITIPSGEGLIYDGQAKEVKAVAKATVIGMGKVTVDYYKGTTKLESAPTEAGTYTFKLNVAGDGQNYSAKEFGNRAWTFTIEKKQLTVNGTSVADRKYNGTTFATITLGTVNGIAEGDDLKVTVAGAFESENACTSIVENIAVPVKYTISGDDAANYIKPIDDTLYARIEKRDVILTSASDSKVFDGKALTNDTVTVTGDGFIDGEGSDYSDFKGTQTYIGQCENVFDYTFNVGTSYDNYNVKIVYGTLMVTSDPNGDVIVSNDDLKAVLDYFKTKEGYKYCDSVFMKTDGEISKDDVALIKEKTGLKKLILASAELYLAENGDEIYIGDENEILVGVSYKFDFAKQKDAQVFRVHEGELDELKETPNDSGEYVKFDKENGTVTVYAAKYSTFAVAYNDVATTNTGDANDMAPWALAMLVSVIGLAGYGLKRKNN